YTYEKLLGKGGQGSVWLALAEVTQELGKDAEGQRVAIKVFNEQHMRGQREVETLEKLLEVGRHPNIVRFIKHFEEQSIIVMQYIEGESLKQRLLRAGKRLGNSEVKWISTGFLRGLGVLHALNISHRDVKPDNIMLAVESGVSDESDRVVLVDFGLSKEHDAEQTITKDFALLGTAAYMSPERLQPGKTDLRVDVWAAGVVMFEM
ncbi:kinase-like domain-containing protein, partial [Baffinella frigidus]